MTDTIRIIGQAMRAEADTLRTLSQNIANSETVGYRRQVPVTHTQFDALLQDVAAGADAQPATQLDVAFDFSPAALKRTDVPLDVALAGPGFFVVDTPQGPLLTRRGDLHVAADGTLVSFLGAPVLGEKGPIQISSSNPSIAADGTISVNGDVIDRLRVINVAKDANLESLGDGTFRTAIAALEEQTGRASVRQGFLEGSNVAPVNEMIQMMETLRRFEAEQRFARAYDGMLDKAISELGKIG